MKHYTEDFKQALVKKALSKPEISPRHFATEAGIASSSLYKWITLYADSVNGTSSNIKKSPQDWTLEEQFNMIQEAANLSVEGVGAYCRQKGIYQHQLKQWREEFMAPKKEAGNSKDRAELKTLRSENRALKKELTRKEKALAEASALLILKKKAHLLWGGTEDD